jgi:predicted acyltransferase
MGTQKNSLPSGRIISIDALRGFDMFWIIGGSSIVALLMRMTGTPLGKTVAAQFTHSEWHGFTFEDLIFPLFLFIVGLSIPLSLEKRLGRGDPRSDILSHIFTRALILYFLGMIVNAKLISTLGGLRYTGVLHRIAVCYLFASLIVLHSRTRGRVLWFAGLLAGYWAVMALVPVPGYGSGILTPEGSLASWFDRHYLPGQLRHELFDNEGILSTFPAIATALLGVLASGWLTSTESPTRKTAGILAAGGAFLALGLFWNIIFPINKLLWTSSFVLFAGGWSLLLLGIFYWLIDVRGFRKWAFPFTVIGMNSIAIYWANMMFDFGLIVTIFTYGFENSLGLYKSLFLTVSALAVKWLFLYGLYRKRIFLKA